MGGLILQAVGECCEDELLYEKTSSSAVCNSDGDSGANSDYFHCSSCKSNKRIVVSIGVKGRKHGLPTIAASFPLQESNVPYGLSFLRAPNAFQKPIEYDMKVHLLDRHRNELITHLPSSA